MGSEALPHSQTRGPFKTLTPRGEHNKCNLTWHPSAPVCLLTSGLTDTIWLPNFVAPGLDFWGQSCRPVMTDKHNDHQSSMMLQPFVFMSDKWHQTKRTYRSLLASTRSSPTKQSSHNKALEATYTLDYAAKCMSCFSIMMCLTPAQRANAHHLNDQLFRIKFTRNKGKH